MRDRVDILREGIGQTDKIVEIGPSFSPLTPKRDGWRCFTVDHADQERLVEKYRHDPSVDVAMIEPVDFVWTEAALSDAVPVEHHGTFDVFLASHVIEHIPDLIGFLRSAEALVRSSGRMVLAIPDKRVCFDFFRPLTTTGDLLASHRERRARYMPKVVWDCFAYQVTKHGAPGWGRTDQATAAFTYTLEQALASIRRYDAGAFIDAHYSTFVPASFALIMLELARLGLTDWQIERSETAEYTEFYVWLRRGALAKVAEMSETELANDRLCLLNEMLVELNDQGRQLALSWINRHLRQAEVEWAARLEQKQQELANALNTIETMRLSRAWRGRTRLRKLLRLPRTLSDC